MRSAPAAFRSRICASSPACCSDVEVRAYPTIHVDKRLAIRLAVFNMAIQRCHRGMVNFLPYPTPLFDGDGNLASAVNLFIEVTE
jgi:hypothetical protein